MTTDGDLFIASEPLDWPAITEPMSFSAFLVLRACARRWAYPRSHFAPGGLVDDRGLLHKRASWGAIRGRAVHTSLETLLDIHQVQGGPAAGSWSLLQFWKRHLPSGGIPALVSAALNDELAQAERSPRNRGQMTWLRQSASRDLGGLVASVNSKLALALQGGGSKRDGTGAGRRSLGIGSHAEVTIEAELCGSTCKRRWRGIIDVARIEPDAVRLVDYKGGAEQPTHREQLELYALLYWKDEVVNPTRRRATELTLAYDNGRTINWAAPEDDQLATIELSTCEELETLIRATETTPPTAHPSAEACGFCSARPLCSAYWNAPLVSDGSRFDLELFIEDRSPSGDELVGRTLRSTRAVLPELVRVLVPLPWRQAVRNIDRRKRVRIVGATTPETEEVGTMAVVVLDPFAELIGLHQAEGL